MIFLFVFLFQHSQWNCHLSFTEEFSSGSRKIFFLSPPIETSCPWCCEELCLNQPLLKLCCNVRSKLHHAKRTANKEQQHSLPWWVWLEKGEKGLVCLSEQKKGWQIRGWGMIVVFKYIKAHREGNHQRETKAIQDGKQDYQKDSQASIDWPLINLEIRGKHGRLRKVLEQFFKVKW